VIFPEGTCTNGEYLISFKKGAFKPLLPMKIFMFEYPVRNLSLASTVLEEFILVLLALC